MRHADTPAGPGKPLRERTEAVTEQEEIDEMEAAPGDDTGSGVADENARHADRNAHGKEGRDGAGDDAGGGS